MPDPPVPALLTRRAVCGGLASALLAGKGLAQPLGPFAPLVFVRNGRELGPGGSRLRDILIRGGRIAANGRAGSTSSPAGARVLDARGAFVLPGLIDAHAHYGWAAELGESGRHPWETTGKQLLASGVTTVRMHLSNPLEMAEYLARSGEGAAEYPRIELGGKGLVGGAPDLDRGLIWGVRGAADARAKVERSASAGATWIALHEVDRFASEELDEIRDSAGRTGISLLGSGERISEVQAALRAGVRSVEYLDLSPAPIYPVEVIQALQARRRVVFIVPTIGHYVRHMAHVRGNATGDAAAATRFMASEAAQRMLTSVRSRFAAAPNAYDTRLRTNFATLEGKFAQLRNAGLEMVIGTDSGSAGHYHGDAIWWEMATWHALGVPPREVIAAATSRPARMMRRADLGVLTRGARGDLVIYEGDLERGVFEARNVRTVIKGGEVHVQNGTWAHEPLPGS